MSAAPLDFLLIGAQKCATSWLYLCLRDHPGILVPHDKRELHYLGGDNLAGAPVAPYVEFAKDRPEGVVAGAASVEYLADPRSPVVVREALPEIKLIVNLRNPVERAVSGFYWYVRRGKVPEMGVDEGITLALDEREAGRDSPSADIIYRGEYAGQIERYRSFVPAERFLVHLYDEICEDAGAALARTYRFLGVDPGFQPASLGKRPKKNTYFRPLILLERVLPHHKITAKLADMANRALSRGGVGTDEPQLSATLQCRLLDYYVSHIRVTQRVLNAMRPSADAVDLERLWIEPLRRSR